ncbi:MAG: chemotaxis protein CheW [Bdellovibrionales bacterium]
MDDLLREFLTETGEGLAKLDQELIELEQRPTDAALLGSIFRVVHTIKGTCGFIGLPRLEKVAHAGENVLGKFRDGKLAVTPEAITLILGAVDQIKYLVSEIEARGTEPAGDDSALIERLNRHATGGDAPLPVVEMPRAPGDPATPAQDSAELEALFAATPGPADTMRPLSAPSVPAKAEPDARSSAVSVADQSIRIQVDVLEGLMNTVSELVLTRNQLLQIARTHGRTELTSTLQRLNLVTSELQEGVMKTRMQPIGTAWQKLPRIIRDLARDLGKKIDLEMVGQEAELDRQMLELIRDPLLHMIRNSADHGLEMPADRVAAGKPETGRILLSSYHQGGHIIIEIKDDGRGLNVDRIAQKALEKGLTTEAELAGMSDQQICKFIFVPGFSTASQVTEISGRGVGMDVVRANIEKIGGSIDLYSEAGKGSTFTIKIPLTLAIINALIIECAGETFAIPQLAVTELVRVVPGGEYRIEMLNNAPVLRLRNRLLPLVQLQSALKLGGQKTDNVYVIVMQVGNNRFGVIVDRLFDTEEIVVKPVAPILGLCGMFSGNTIMGDGRVILIIDPNGVSELAGDCANMRDDATALLESKPRSSLDKMAFLLFKASGMAPRAVSLALVTRIEEFDLANVEFPNDKPMIQYRGQLMPLVPFDPLYKFGKKGVRRMLVFTDRDRSMGLIIDQVLDVVEERLHVEVVGDRPGIMGSAIIGGRATDVIDAAHYLGLAHKDWFEMRAGVFNDAGAVEEDVEKRILLVDDSPFFRNLLSPLLAVAGYTVITCEDPKLALQMMEAGEKFDLIVSDIEMPGMNGFQFAEAVRAGDIWKSVPMIALSSHATPKDLERGRASGFTDYVAKFDREALLAALQQAMRQIPGPAHDTRMPGAIE